MDLDSNALDEAKQTEERPPLGAVGVVDSPTDTNLPKTYTNKGTREPMSRFEFAIVWLTVFGLLVTAATAALLYRQLKEMIGQNDLADISARQARKDSADTAKSVDRQLRIADQQARALQQSNIQFREAAQIEYSPLLSLTPWLGFFHENGIFVCGGRSPQRNQEQSGSRNWHQNRR